MKTAIRTARCIAGFLSRGAIPGYVVAFDGDIFMGVLPIKHWNSLFIETMNVNPYDSFAIIIHDEPSPEALETIHKAAKALGVDYQGAIRVGAARTPTPPAQSTGVQPE